MNAMAALGEFDKAHLSAIGRQAEAYDAGEGDVFTVTLGWRVCHGAHPHIGGEVIGWADPVDDFLKPCAQDHPDAVFRTILVRWDEGTKPQLSERVPAGRVRGEGWRPEHAAPPAPLKFLSYDDMIALPDPEWLVDGLIAFETSALLFGKSNCFKSFLAIDIAASVATGRADCHQPRRGRHSEASAEIPGAGESTLAGFGAGVRGRERPAAYRRRGRADRCNGSRPVRRADPAARQDQGRCGLGEAWQDRPRGCPADHRPLARALGMPDHAALAGAAHIMLLDGLDGAPDPEELLVARNLADAAIE